MLINYPMLSNVLNFQWLKFIAVCKLNIDGNLVVFFYIYSLIYSVSDLSAKIMNFNVLVYHIRKKLLHI